MDLIYNYKIEIFKIKSIHIKTLYSRNSKNGYN